MLLFIPLFLFTSVFFSICLPITQKHKQVEVVLDFVVGVVIVFPICWYEIGKVRFADISTIMVPSHRTEEQNWPLSNISHILVQVSKVQ